MEIYNNEKIVNNNYAPGIATYGIDGKTGDKGEYGTSVYFTTYNLEYDRDLDNERGKVLVKINQNKLLTSYTDKVLERPYDVGDIIIDGRGYMYRIFKNNGVFDLQYISKLDINDSNSIFHRYNDRVVLGENGLDIYDVYDTNNLDYNYDKYPLRIISTKPNTENGRYEMLSFNCKPYSGKERFLNIYYDKSEDAIRFESDSRIVFDVENLMVDENDATRKFGNYYKLEPYNDPIGLLHREYSMSKYVLTEDDEGDWKIEILDLELNKFENLNIFPDFLKICVYDKGQLSNEYMLLFDNTTGNLSVRLSEKLVSVLKRSDIMYTVSLVKGIEVMIDKKEE